MYSLKVLDKFCIALITSQLVAQAGFAIESAPKSSQVEKPSSSEANDSAYSQLFGLMNGLEFPGWKLAKSGLYVDMNKKFKQVMVYSNNSSSSKPGYKYDQEYQKKKIEELRSHSFRQGEEGILRECGCHAVAQKIFRRGNRFVTFEGFQFDSPVGANAGYNFLRSGSTTVIKRGNGSSEDAQSISFWKGNFFFRVFTQEHDDDEAKDVVRDIANFLTSKVVSSAGTGKVFRFLPTMDRVKGSEKIVLGPLTAQHYFTVPYISTLNIERSRGAVVADYQVYHPHRERLKVLYIDYGDPHVAQKAYFDFATNISQLKAPVKGGPDSSPRSLFKLNKRFMLCELKPRGRVLVITGARKKVSSGVLARQI